MRRLFSTQGQFIGVLDTISKNDLISPTVWNEMNEIFNVKCDPLPNVKCEMRLCLFNHI